MFLLRRTIFLKTSSLPAYPYPRSCGLCCVQGIRLLCNPNPVRPSSPCLLRRSCSLTLCSCLYFSSWLLWSLVVSGPKLLHCGGTNINIVKWKLQWWNQIDGFHRDVVDSADANRGPRLWLELSKGLRSRGDAAFMDLRPGFTCTRIYSPGHCDNADAIGEVACAMI